jgi:hypothetical protein
MSNRTLESRPVSWPTTTTRPSASASPRSAARTCFDGAWRLTRSHPIRPLTQASKVWTAQRGHSGRCTRSLRCAFVHRTTLLDFGLLHVLLVVLRKTAFLVAGLVVNTDWNFSPLPSHVTCRSRPGSATCDQISSKQTHTDPWVGFSQAMQVTVGRGRGVSQVSGRDSPNRPNMGAFPQVSAIVTRCLYTVSFAWVRFAP